MNAPSFGVPLPQPPHDPSSWLLNAAAGWRQAKNGTLPEVEQTPGSGALALPPAPGSRRALTEPGGSFGGLVLPPNVALGPDGSIYLLDARSLTLKRFDPCACRFEGVPCFGGEGGGARQLRNPHGIGICSGNLFVCDTGVNASAEPVPCDEPEQQRRNDARVRRENHRLSVFALHGFVLRGHWRPPAAAYRSPDPALTQPWEPFALAFDGQGRVYVTDGANACIHRFSPAGHWELFRGGLGQVTHLAIDCGDRIYVIIDEGRERRVRVLDADGSDVTVDPRVEALARHFPRLPFPVDASGALHLGALCAADDAGKASCPPNAARPAPERGVFDSHGDPVTSAPPPPAPAYSPAGTYFSTALDSELYRCQWHRILLRGRIPEGARLLVSTYTAEAELTEAQVQNLPPEAWETRQVVRETEGGRWVLYPAGRYEFAPTKPRPHDGCAAGEWDCLIRSGGGRYLWLRLDLAGNGKVTPVVARVVLEFPRISLRRYLPAVFGEEPMSADFTDRFLGLFDTTLRRVEHEVDTVARYFDPLATPAERDPRTGTDFLSWLASWIGITLDRHWPEAKRRELVKRAGKLYDLRGTREGLWRLLLLFLGMEAERCCCPEDQPRARCRPEVPNCAPPVERPCAWEPPPLILEHYRLRRWLFVGSGRLGEQALLWGRRIVNRSQLNEGAQAGVSQLITTPDPYRDPFHVYAHKFTVFVPARCGQTETGRKALENLLKAESPAHTQSRIEYVEPRFRIGFQSMIGLDTVIARLPEGVTLNETRLGPASLLTAPPHAQGGPSLEVGESRVGTTMKLD